MSAADNINALLNDKLFQVIGSTPTSIGESLAKVDLRGRKEEGITLAAVAVFAAAVNKATLETFLAEQRFAKVRPLISAAMSIQGKSNMTAMTLFGHCLMTTSVMNDVTFAAEFRKKMGQQHLWDGDLDKGSLSDKQKEILKEKKRVTKESEAKALGSGYMKHIGVVPGAMSEEERKFFPGVQPSSASGTAPASAAVAALKVDRRQVLTPSSVPAPVQAPATPSRAPAVASPETSPRTVAFTASSNETFDIPEDVLRYRYEIMGQTNDDITDSLQRKGVDRFIRDTRKLAQSDPTGERIRAASIIGK